MQKLNSCKNKSKKNTFFIRDFICELEDLSSTVESRLSGHIGIQDHSDNQGQEVWVVEIHQLSPYPIFIYLNISYLFI